MCVAQPLLPVLGLSWPLEAYTPFCSRLAISQAQSLMGELLRVGVLWEEEGDWFGDLCQQAPWAGDLKPIFYNLVFVSSCLTAALLSVSFYPLQNNRRKNSKGSWDWGLEAEAGFSFTEPPAAPTYVQAHHTGCNLPCIWAYPGLCLHSCS